MRSLPCPSHNAEYGGHQTSQPMIPKGFPDVNKLFSAFLSIAGTTAAIALTASASQAASFTVSGVTGNILGNSCPTNICTTLQKAGYTVSGGGTLDPAANKKNRYLIPGSDNKTAFEPVNNAYKIQSYNVTSRIDDPVGAINPIMVSNLSGTFSFLWGSVDNYNKVEFFKGDQLVSTITGTNLATALSPLVPASPNSAGNYNFDAFVKFTGDFTGAKLSVFKPTNTATQIAFEVAAASVPEASGVSTLLAIGAVLGGVALKTRLQ